MRRDATDGDGEVCLIELADTRSDEESCGPQDGRQPSLYSLRRELRTTHPLLPHGAPCRGPVLSCQLLHTPELCGMEMSALQSLRKPWLGTDHSRFCVGLIREADRTIDIHSDTSCWTVTERLHVSTAQERQVLLSPCCLSLLFTVSEICPLLSTSAAS